MQLLRRIVLAIFALASISSTVAAIIGFKSPVHEWIRIGRGTDLHVRWSDGLLRVLLFRSDPPLNYRRSGRMLHLSTDVSPSSVYSLRFVHPWELRALSRAGNPLPPFMWNPKVAWTGPMPGAPVATVSSGIIRLPAWVPPVVFLLYPLSVLTRNWFAARKRRRPGECATCGYDLTGNSSGRCPECGAATTA